MPCMIWSLLAFPAHAFSSIAPSYSSGLIQLSSWPSLTIHSKANFPSLLFSYYLTLHCFHVSITLTTYYVFSYIHLLPQCIYSQSSIHQNIHFANVGISFLPVLCYIYSSHNNDLMWLVFGKYFRNIFLNMNNISLFWSRKGQALFI